MESNAAKPVDRVLRFPEVQAITGLPISSAYEAIAAGTFPRPIKIGPRAVGFLQSEVTAWVAARVAERDAALEAAGA